MTDIGTSFADHVDSQLAPLKDVDLENGQALRNFVLSASQMFQLIDWLSQDSDDGPGWSRLVNIDKTPAEAIPYLAQFVGVVLPAGLSEDEQRAFAKSAAGWRRGTRASMIGALQARLTGSKQVTFVERNGGPYNLTVVTKATETPDTAAALAALLSQKPAGLILDYVVTDYKLYLDVFTSGQTYAQVMSTYATYKDLLFNNQSPGVPTPPAIHSFYGASSYGTSSYG